MTRPDPALAALAEVAFWSLCFLDTADSDQLDDDVAVEQGEALVQLLREGGPTARAAVARVAERVAREDVRPAVRAFAEGLVADVWDDPD